MEAEDVGHIWMLTNFIIAESTLPKFSSEFNSVFEINC